MYAGVFANKFPERPAVIMADSGEVISYAELEAAENRLAHLFRHHGLRALDHYAIFMENDPRYVECCGAGARSGLYYTCVNSFLTADEVAYIVDNCDAKLMITSRAKYDVAMEALKQCPKVTLCLVVDGPGNGENVRNYAEAVATFPATPIADERFGASMLYSSGTTGRPKGILRALPDVPPSTRRPLYVLLEELWRYRKGMIYLSPAPLYHSAPQGAVGLTILLGGTAIIMERFDAERFLQLVERYRITHSQLVPTMFSRLLKLPREMRAKYDLSSLEAVVHAAAPCPPQVKEQMIEWFGPIIHEYYGATEAHGMTACGSDEWLAHKGTVGKVVLGEVHILDDDHNELPAGAPGAIWFRAGMDFEYFKDSEKTRESRSPDGSLCTVGDVGYLDDDGYLYLTDRKNFMIISGGVNIYPQECENLLILHHKVADAAVFGVPNADLGEEVKAVVQAAPGIDAGPNLADELIAFCMNGLAPQKVPRSIDFMDELPRLPTGKLYKRILRDKYWLNQSTSVI